MESTRASRPTSSADLGEHSIGVEDKKLIIRIRWWDCCQLISWPDHLLYNVSALIRGNDAETRIIRKTIARYAILSSVLAWRSISLRVLTRYPTDDHLLDSGLLTKEELALFKTINVRVDPHQVDDRTRLTNVEMLMTIEDEPKWFVPINWIQTMMVRCFEKGTLGHTNELRVLLDALEKYRNGFFQLFIYDWIAIPLVYTQVSTISVYGYFAFALIGRQFPSQNEYREVVDMYVPIFTILQFLFYVGWLKVGEDLMFPFGADDEDFEFNYILERNLEMAFLIVDELHNQVPPVYVESLDDKVELMHTRASIRLSNHPQRQHLRKYRMKEDAMQISREPSLKPGNKCTPASGKTSELSFADFDYMANGPREKKPQS
ncbi:Bestrophin [Ancylostoma ceylanicum]|uniref:Bestrophin homolog n=1 Tax=Ancylostoma ceylanicum TaxID=53326 RepID=A0A0D6LFK9_9BILA|nr:Bestrophin [Ancylostoma ceylanicum]